MKHFSRFSLTSFLLFFFSAASVSAALPQTFNNVLRIIAEPLQVLFVVVPKSSAFPLLLKFLYFIILAALWSGIAAEITKNRESAVKRAFKIFGVIVALISAIFIPQSWLLYAFKLPAMISIVLFFLVVPLGGYFLCHRLIPGDSTAARLGRAFIWWILALLVLGLVEFIQTHPDPALQQMISPVLDALNIAAVVALFAGLYNFAMGLGAGRAAEAARDAIRGETAPPGTTPPGTTPPGTTTPPGPAPPGQRPAPNLEQLRELTEQIRRFQEQVDEFLTQINDPRTGLRAFYQHNTGATIPPADRRNNAQRILPRFEAVAAILQPMQQTMNTILENPQYPNLDTLGTHIREGFEYAIATFLQHQNDFSVFHANTILHAE